jgi:hypothetical protein
MRTQCLVAALVAALGCATTPPRVAPERVLLAPVSFNQTLPEALEPGVQVVRDEMAAQLVERGVAVSAPPLTEFHDVWLGAAREIGTLYDAKGRLDAERFADASRALVAAYRSRSEFDVLLLGYLDVRVATVRGGRASWDGVKRLVPIDFGGGRKELVRWPNRFQLPCVSLRVLAYTADGAALFEERGGLDVAIEYLAGSLESRPRQDLFADASALREGVGIALAPLLPD